MARKLLVSIVDDDESVRESLPDLLREFGFEVRAFSSAEEFLASDSIGETGCHEHGDIARRAGQVARER